MMHSTHTTRLFSVENLGCAKNQVDAEVMIRYLTEAGWEYTEEHSHASLIIVNSCGFIEPAKQESIETTLELKDRYPDARILLTGCLSQRYGEVLTGELEEADGIFGNRDLSGVVDVADRVLEGEKPLSLPPYYEYDRRRDNLLSFPGSAYLKISEGCNHRCSFCAIPLIRGGLRSIPKETIIDEAKRLISRGVYEINLIAQDLASYGEDLTVRKTDYKGEASPFLDLLRELDSLSGNFRLRLLYIHPDNFPRELVSIIRDSSKIVPYFDIPFQHASKKVLSAMGRKGDAQTYLSLIREIREGLPDAVIRTSFLVGFYGEGEEEFEELLRFQKEAAFDWAGVFTYSPEEDTPALSYEGKPGFERESDKAAERENILKKKQQEISEKRMERFVGRKLNVLIEEPVEGEGLFLGRAYLHAPEVDGLVVLHGPEELEEAGKTVKTSIVRRNNIDLEGVVDE